MTSLTDQQSIAIHILANNSRSKGNQAMKFDLLIEYNMRDIFLKNHTRNVVEKLFPDPFLKNLPYLWINILKFYTVFFIVCQVEDYRNILKLSFRPLAFTSHKGFLKNKKRSVTSFSASFSARFLNKNISLVIWYHVNKFHFLVASTSCDILGTRCIVSVC